MRYNRSHKNTAEMGVIRVITVKVSLVQSRLNAEMDEN